MRGPHRLRDYVASGLVNVETLDALLAFGEPMVTEMSPGYWRDREYRAWIRLCGGGRVMGQPWHSTPQAAATALLAKLRNVQAPLGLGA